MNTSGQTTNRRARVAVLVYFALAGLAVAVWVARIPGIKGVLALSDGRLGIALACMSGGGLLAMFVIGRLVDRLGSARVTAPAAVLLGGAVLLPGLAPSLPLLCAGLFVFGATLNLLDIAMNAHAVEVERAYGRPLMSSFHAAYSFGGLGGSLLGGLFARLDLSPLANFIALGIPLAVAGWGLRTWLLRPASAGTRDVPASGSALPEQTGASVSGPVPPEHAGGASASGPTLPERVGGAPERFEEPVGETAPETVGTNAGTAPVAGRALGLGTVVLLGAIGFFATMGEGASGDWSGVYLHEDLGTSTAVAALGFAAVSLTMAFGRLLGDRLALRFGPVALVRASGLLAAAGLGAGLLIPHPWVAIAGFGAFGAGLACIVPQVFSAAGNADPARSGRNLALVAGLGYTGILAGPVIIGAVSTVAGLRVALAVPAVLALAIALLAGATRPRREQAVRPGG